TSDKNKVGVDEIAETLSVPKHFLAKILQQLTKNNLAASSKGRYGGFYLTDKQKSSTILPIIESIDGPATLEGCVLGLPDCSNMNPCSFHHEISKFRSQLMDTLGKETIEETAIRMKVNNFKM
ncbi:MAG: Rrf2 family transcriptional regulator, partial [Bacteroidia bacterium]|nr:Rrf2 family transcriptional regulator [Bacteroidia bacterium]